VYIGNAGGDNFGVRGRMMAFDARSGGRLWSVELVAEHGRESATWPPAVELVPRTGGATWTSYTLDTARGALFVPTGNPGPDFLASVRAGDNLYTASVVELDARTGCLTSWHQLTPADFHDWDQAAAPVLVEARGGRQLIAAGSKDGHLYGIDRATGRRLYATPVATIENVHAPLTAEGTRFCPGVNGGVEWNGPAYSPLTGALYVGSIDWCSTVKLAPPEKLEGKRAIPWTGSSQLKRPFGTYDTKRKGWLTAVNADDGSVRWRYDSPTPLVAGVTTTAGGLVFTADLAGSVMAFDATIGKELWRASTGQPVGGGIVTYAARGKQYVAVASGMHSPVAWQIESTPATLVVFALP
jgi:glucose dehydrogenase